MESSIFILQKVAHKVVQTTFFLRVDVGLCEHFIDSVNGCDRALIRVRHAFDFDAAFFVLHVHREQILQVQDAESIMDLIHEGVVDEFGVFATCAFTLFLGLLPHFLHLNVLQMLRVLFLLRARYTNTIHNTSSAIAGAMSRVLASVSSGRFISGPGTIQSGCKVSQRLLRIVSGLQGFYGSARGNHR